MPGEKNDINIMNSSPLFNEIPTGQWPPFRPSTTVQGVELSWYYFLVDGIYPKFRFFMTTFNNPRNLKEKFYGKHQEGARKSVERVFGVLFKRFGILYRPCRIWHMEEMTTAATACVIIHNMIVSQRRDKYNGTQNIRLPKDDTRMPTEVLLVRMPHTCYEQAKFWRAHFDDCEDIAQHMLLKNALVDHIWAAIGE
jgi:Plant transposon protein